ncbi:MAG: GNAT family N-acetyltransferase [Pyrinomonadaceae bacterium]
MSRLETDRLRFDLYIDRDEADFIKLLTDPVVMRFVPKGPLTLEQAGGLWEKLMLDLYPKGVDTIWAVFSKDDKRYVGNASLRPRPERQKDWEIGYYLKPAEWGKGFATEIASRLIRHGVDVAGLGEIYATVDKHNQASINVLEKCGLRLFRKEYDDERVFHIFRTHL